MPILADLVSQTQLAVALADLVLSAAQLGELPTLAAAASRAVRRFCNRDFTQADYDEVYEVRSGSSLVLRQFPVVAVDRVASDVSTVLEITQTDSLTNSRAAVALAATGDADAGLTSTGLTLTRVASGARVAVSVPFSTAPTVAALAAAVNGLGAGWSAVVADGMGGLASADFRAPWSGPAMGPNAPARLVQHADDLAYRLDDRRGILQLERPGAASADSPRFGPAPGDGPDDVEPFGGVGGVRVWYTAGFATVPPDVAQLTAEAVKASLERFAMDTSLKSESDGVLSWTGRDELFPLSPGVRSGLSSWVNHRG